MSRAFRTLLAMYLLVTCTAEGDPVSYQIRYPVCHFGICETDLDSGQEQSKITARSVSLDVLLIQHVSILTFQRRL
jgi:hypothetical protein